MTRYARARLFLSFLAPAVVACSGATLSSSSDEEHEHSATTNSPKDELGPTSAAGAAAATTPVFVEPASVTTTTIVGRITVGRAVVLRGQAGAPSLELALRDANRQAYKLVLSANLLNGVGGLAALQRSRVRVTGVLVGKTLTATAIARVTNVVEKTVSALPSTASFPTRRGTTRLTTLLCRFSGTPSPAAESRAFFQTSLDDQTAHVGDYFKKVSLHRFALDGSNVVDPSANAESEWFTLPPLSSYAVGDSYDSEAISYDCTAAAFFGGIDLSTADIIQVALSHNLSDNRGYIHELPLDDFSISRTIPAVVTTPVIYRDQANLTKTLAAGLGLRSTSEDAPTAASPRQDSQWDLMSAGGTCAPLDPSFGCVEAHPSTVHKDLVGWLDPAEKVTVGSGTQTVTLLPARRPGAGVRLVVVPTSEARYLTIEARERPGATDAFDYDQRIPDSGLVLHDVDITAQLSGEAPFLVGRLLDLNGNGNPNDGGSILKVGGRYESASGALIEFLGASAAGYQVRVTRSYPMTIALDGEDHGDITLNGANRSLSGTITIDRPRNSTNLITAKPDTDYTGSITGCEHTTNGCSVTMDGPKTVNVAFLAKEVILPCWPSTGPNPFSEKVCDD